MTGTVRITVDEATGLVAAALLRAGVNEDVVNSTARALVAAERDGQRGHGLSRVRSYCDQVRCGKVLTGARPTLEAISDAAIVVDAAHGFAYPAIDVAIDALKVVTPRSGIAVGAIKRSHHFGQAGAHVERLAAAGLVAFLFGNSPSAIAFWGGSKPMMGTNPIAFAAPLRGRPPLVIDLALSVAARGKIMAANKAGETIPEGWALDKDGHPTTDAAAALDGSMAPVGGAKGAALALMVEVLAAALTGSKFGFEASSFLNTDGPPPDVGCVFLALDPHKLSGGGFLDRMDVLLAAIAGEEGPRVPGDKRIMQRKKTDADGLFVSPQLIQEIQDLASQKF